MEKLIVNDAVSLSSIAPHHAEPLFSLVEENREYLREWLPWLDSTQTIDDINRFIKTVIEQREKGLGQQFVICLNPSTQINVSDKSVVCGVVGLDRIDKAHRSGAMGYWLAEAYSGHGIMTAAVSCVLALGFRDYQLNKIDIRCATENTRSRAIPERLGFTCEATLRQCEWLYDHYVDHAVYSLLAKEYQ